MSYYDEILAEIHTAMEEKDYEEAAFLLKREFSMPYLPQEFEAQLKELERQVRFARSETKERGEEPIDSLLRKLKGKPQSQLSAAAALCDRNLRTVLEELKDWMSKDPQPEAASLLINALAEQEIDAEFTITRNGVEYTFTPELVTPVAQSEGLRQGLTYLETWLMKEPSLLELARSLLVAECYNALPLSYEAGDAKMLAEQCMRTVLRSMDMEDRFDSLISETV
ncbi:MAG: DUF3196 family protein [Solobacterium sp.]|nr:DUF3196 family protein [Solobacterium sp.]